MATVTFTYVFEDINDEFAAQMREDYTVGVYGRGPLGTFVSAHRLPPVYSSNPEDSIRFDFGDAADELDAPLILCGEFIDPSLTPPF